MKKRKSQGIKEFQKVTVDHVVKALSQKNCDRFLVADEVGLGKTIIAREIIKKVQSGELKISMRKNVTEVMYICSNQDIAKQNVDKLVEAIGEEDRDKAPRSTLMMVKEPEVHNGVKLLSITPKTSLDLDDDSGTKEERFFIHSLFELLVNGGYLAKSPAEQGWTTKTLKASRFFKDKAYSMDPADWAHKVKNYSASVKVAQILKDKEQFCSLLKKEWNSPLGSLVRFSDNQHAECLNAKESLLKNVESFIRFIPPKKDDESTERRRVQRFLIGYLRKGLAKASLSCQHPDLIILDEFQNFSSIIPKGKLPVGGEETESLARLLFESKDKKKFLFLSATPFKFQMLEYGEAQSGSFDSFWDVIEMLLHGDQNVLEDVKGYFNIYWEAIQDKKILSDSQVKKKAIGAKKSIENILTKTIVRTEKFSVPQLKNPVMEELKTSWLRSEVSEEHEKLKAKVAPKDIDVLYLKFMLDTAPEGSGWIAQELWQSIPFAYNLMGTDYQIYLQKFKDGKKNCQDIIKLTSKKKLEVSTSHNWGSFEQLMNLDLGTESPNPKVRAFLSEIEEENYGYYLWVPPKNPYYGSRPYKKSEKLPSKRLIFSHWQAVPHAVSILGSLHIEKLLTKELTREKQEIEYDQTGYKFSVKLDYYNSKKKQADYGNFLIFFPFIRLAEINIHSAYMGCKDSEEAVLRRVVGKVKNLAKSMGLKPGEDIKYKGEPRAQMIFEFLLMMESTDHKALLVDEFPIIFKYSLDNKAKGQIQKEITRIRFSSKKIFDFTSQEWLLIAKIVLSSPAVALIRAMNGIDRVIHPVVPKGKQAKPYLALHNVLHTQFRALFRSHHGGLALNAFSRKFLDEKRSPKWDGVLNYCFQCQIQAMLDEWLYLLNGDFGSSDHEKFIKSIHKVIGLPAGHPAVQEPPNGSHPIRRHIVQSFTNDKRREDPEKGGSIKPILRDQIRLSFNSPFWPFALVTTSIGQEGLDFHRYCKDIVHWNIPKNPSNFEQREGRIRRYLGKSVRDAIQENPNFSWSNVSREMARYAPWKVLMEKVCDSLKDDFGGLSPWWVYSPLGEKYQDQINRWLYCHPFSDQAEEYAILKESVLLYRLALGNPNPEDLLETIKRNIDQEIGSDREKVHEAIKELVGELTINLSPYFSGAKKAKKPFAH